MDESHSDATQAITPEPENGYDWYVLAGLHAKAHRYAEALNAYERSARLDPDHWVTWYKLANVRQLLEKHGAAVQAYGEALRINPNAVSAYIHRAQSYLAMGDTASAISDMETALDREPRSKRIRQLLEDVRREG